MGMSKVGVNKRFVGFMVDKAVHKALQHHSVDIEVSLTDIMREAVELYMEKYGITVEKKGIKAVR